MSEITEEQIRLAAQGDVEAFEKIYRTYSKFVYNVAYRVVQHMEDAQEITQEVFLIVHRKLESFQFQSSLKTWLYRVTTNTSLNYVKKRSRKQKRESTELIEDYHSYEAKNNVERPEDNLHKQDNEGLIQQLLNHLNPDQRACIVLRNMEGLSYEEIAETLQININTVRTRLKRAREKLLAIKSEVMYEVD